MYQIKSMLWYTQIKVKLRFYFNFNCIFTEKTQTTNTMLDSEQYVLTFNTWEF